MPNDYEYRGRDSLWCRQRARDLIRVAAETGVYAYLPEHLIALRKQEYL